MGLGVQARTGSEHVNSTALRVNGEPPRFRLAQWVQSGLVDQISQTALWLMIVSLIKRYLRTPYIICAPLIRSDKPID